MKKIIHKLRQQPEDVRRSISHILTIMFAVVLIILWTYSLSKNLSNPDVQVRAKNDLQPFSVLKDNLVGGYNSISEPASNMVR
jgi:predicted anti-sigma-YlaC factor YlaD